MKRRAFLRRSGETALLLAMSPRGLLSGSEKRAPLKFLVLQGTARERGRIHGESLKSEIREMLELAKEGAREAGVNPEDYIQQITGRTGLLAAAQKWTPHLVDEIRGIAEGAGLDFKTVVAWNFLDESDWFLNERRWANPSSAKNNRCSVIGVWRDGDHPALLAQNADMGPSFDGCQTLFHIKHSESDLEELVLTCPGCVGIYGLNNRSIGVCLNALTNQLNKSSDGLGTIFIARGILAQKTWEDAVKFVQSVKHASGEAYTIGGPEQVACFEGSANKVSQFIPYPAAKTVYHTNHPLANDDLWLDVNHLDRVAPELRESFKKFQRNSETRLQSLKKRLDDTARPVTVEAMKSILSSHDSQEFPVCRHGRPGEGNITTFSMVMELKPSPELHVAPGPPCRTEFKTYRF